MIDSASISEIAREVCANASGDTPVALSDWKACQKCKGTAAPSLLLQLAVQGPRATGIPICVVKTLQNASDRRGIVPGGEVASIGSVLGDGGKAVVIQCGPSWVTTELTLFMRYSPRNHVQTAGNGPYNQNHPFSHSSLRSTLGGSLVRRAIFFLHLCQRGHD